MDWKVVTTVKNGCCRFTKGATKGHLFTQGCFVKYGIKSPYQAQSYISMAKIQISLSIGIFQYQISPHVCWIQFKARTCLAVVECFVCGVGPFVAVVWWKLRQQTSVEQLIGEQPLPLASIVSSCYVRRYILPNASLQGYKGMPSISSATWVVRQGSGIWIFGEGPIES